MALPLEDQLNQSLIFDPYSVEYDKGYDSPLWRPSEKRLFTYQDKSASQRYSYSINDDGCNSKHVDSSDIVPVVNNSIDHENQRSPKVERIDRSIQAVLSVKTEGPNGSLLDISQPLLGVSNSDHNFPVDPHLLSMGPGISLDNLDRSIGCQVTILDEANGSAGMLLAEQGTFDNQEYSFSNNTEIFNSSFHEKRSQIDRSCHIGISLNDGLVSDPFPPPLNSFSPHIRSIQEGQSPVNDSFGNTFPSNEFVLPSTNFLFTRFNGSDESLFRASDFSYFGDGILRNELVEVRYDFGFNVFPTCPSHPVPSADVKCRSSNRGSVECRDVHPCLSSDRGNSEFSIPVLSYSPISITSDQTTVSIKLRKTLYQFGLTMRF